ncbi:hypothetical protein V8C86DRAFT_790450 [Haematococcus lacustris]
MFSLGADAHLQTASSTPSSQQARVFRYDSVLRLTSCAPLWAIILSFDCRDLVPSIQFIESARLVELYASKALNRSTCLAGLDSSTHPLLAANLCQVAAAFFRPLEYVLEMCEAGGLYLPITAADLQAGMPAPNWCLPLHTQLHLQAVKEPAMPPAQQRDHTSLHELALQALSTAPFWSLVHKYHEDTARCDFNWQPRDLVAGLMSKAVSPYTL